MSEYGKAPNFRKSTDDIGQYGTKGVCCGTCIKWLDEGPISSCYPYGQEAEYNMTCDAWEGLKRGEK